jgi:methyl-accepting chemotaxis protein
MKGAVARLVQSFFHLLGIRRLSRQYLFAYLLISVLALANLAVVLATAPSQPSPVTQVQELAIQAERGSRALLAGSPAPEVDSNLKAIRTGLDALAGRDSSAARISADRYQPALNELTQAAGKLRQAIRAYRESTSPRAREAVNTATDRFSGAAQGLATALQQGMRKRTDWLTVVATGIAAAILLLVVLGRFFGSTYLMGRVETLRQHLLEVSRGDLSEGLPVTHQERGNEIGEIFTAFNQMRDKQVEALGQIRDQAQRAGSDSEDLSLNADRISSNAQASSRGVEQVSGSIHEVNNVVQDVANNIQEVSDSASKTTEITQKGQESVTQASRQIDQLKQASQRVEELMTTIETIAKKTDLLALNAAIEAANAGEQGKGFAVVADEVRKLAEQTSDATGQVNEIVSDLQGQSDASVQAMENVQGQMDGVLESIQQTDQTANQIAAAAEELAATMNETAENVGTISTNVEELASSVNLIQEASQQLGNLGFSLERTVKQFRLHPEEAKVGASQGTVDFGQAKIDHFAWKTALRKLLHGEKAMDEEEATSHEHCRLGKWIYSDGLQQFGHFQEMRDLESVHKDLHQSVHRVIELYNQGKTGEAQGEYEHFEQLSDQVVGLLDSLKAKASGEGQAA